MSAGGVDAKALLLWFLLSPVHAGAFTCIGNSQTQTSLCSSHGCRCCPSESLTQAAVCTCTDRCDLLHIYRARLDVQPVVTLLSDGPPPLRGGYHDTDAPRLLMNCSCSTRSHNLVRALHDATFPTTGVGSTFTGVQMWKMFPLLSLCLKE